MLNANKTKLEKVLSRAVKYSVPNYQRNFEWRRDNAEEFWQDIQSQGTFLGTIVFNVSKEETNQEIEIVDGQQRLTTIFILLAALRTAAVRVKNYQQASAIQQFISFIDNTSGASSATKFVASESIRDAFNETIANESWDGKDFNIKSLKSKKRQINRIKPIYSFFAEKVSNFGFDDIKGILSNLYSSIFVEIEIMNTEDAFEIFERTNARGLDLNAADLLKNFLFAQTNLNNIEEKWEQVINYSSGNILRMIKYFYVSKQGGVRKKELFSKLRNYGEIVGSEKFLEELTRYARLYDLIINKGDEDFLEYGKEYSIEFYQTQYNAEEINRSLDAINLFGITQSYPLILKALDSVTVMESSRERETFAKQINQLVKLIENYHFVNSAVSQRPGNVVEKFYTDMCEPDMTVDSLKNIINKVKAKFVEERVKLPEFVERFKELNYHNDYRLVLYINDRFNNHERRGGQIEKMYNSDSRALRRNFDIEHLIAQDSSKYSLPPEKFEDLIHNIGNLIVISKHTNGSLQNKHILDKIPLIKNKDSRLREVQELSEIWENSIWDTFEKIEKNIQERAENMAERAYNKVWLL
jgi:uncharacterized protein with ParB-like and HNH nuclease domain